MKKELFPYKKVNIKKLKRFGFSESDDKYVYYKNILGGQMRLEVVFIENEIYTLIWDCETGEEYVLHNIEGASGEFVGKVRGEYDAIIGRISDECFETEIFKSDLANEIISYAKEKYGSVPEYLWEKFPDNAIFRRPDTKKWYAALLTAKNSSLGKSEEGKSEILDLRANPYDIPGLLDGKKYFPGYHMNKKHWITIFLDGSVSSEEICDMIDKSYSLAV